MSDVHLARRDKDVTEELLLEIAAHCAWENPGVLLPTGEIDMELERDQFEEVALAHFVAQRAAGVQISGDNGCEPTRESLFWRDDKGDYGVRMFNAAWWGWKEAAIATRKTCEVPSLDEAKLAQGEGMPEPSQAQPPAPCEAAREYMTGYSDGREWVQPDHSELVKDAARYRWIRLGKPYRVVVDAPTKKKPDAKITIVVSPSPESDYARALDAAIDAVINAKEQPNG